MYMHICIYIYMYMYMYMDMYMYTYTNTHICTFGCFSITIQCDCTLQTLAFSIPRNICSLEVSESTSWLGSVLGPCDVNGRALRVHPGNLGTRLPNQQNWPQEVSHQLGEAKEVVMPRTNFGLFQK